MIIKYYRKVVYGIVRYYIIDDIQAKLYYDITGQKTMLPENLLDCRELFGAKFQEVLQPKN